eukprot:33124_1
MQSVYWKGALATGTTSIAALAWYTRILPSVPKRQQHVMIHMDLNKTMIMTDTVQGLGFRKSLNTILADTSCWGNVTQCTESNTSNAINGKVWMPVMVETNKNIVKQHSSNANAPLMTYGDFLRQQLPYKTHSVNPQIKHKRRHLREEFTCEGHPGEGFADIVAMLVDKLDGEFIIPAFKKMVEWLYDEKQSMSFSILFRTFGSDLPHVINDFNAFCLSKGYTEICVDLKDPYNIGVMIYDGQIPHLIVGTFEMDPRYDTIAEDMTLERLNSEDRLSFYKNNNDVQCVVKGYKNIYDFMTKQSVDAHKTMAIRDDYCYWALNGEKSAFGKTMIMDCNDSNIHQIFFDDCAGYVLNVRDINDTANHMPFQTIQNVHAVHCNSYEIMTNDDYFINYLEGARSITHNAH